MKKTGPNSITPQRFRFSLLLCALLLLLSACGGSGGGVTYGPGSNGPDGSVVIRGLDAEYLEYTPTSLLPSGGFLYFASPRFLGSVFEGAVTEGTAYLYDTQISVDFVRGGAPDSGTLTGPTVCFTVDLSAQSVSNAAFSPYEGAELSLTDEEMCQIGTALADIIGGAAASHQN